jgi:hypothetical protein
VDAPVRISTPGHSTSGEEGVGDAGCVTPGLALEKRPANLLLIEETVSDEPMLDAKEQPDSSIMAPISSINARPPPRIRLSSRPGRIEITRVFPDRSSRSVPYINQTMATPRRIGDQGDGSSLIRA